MGNDKDWVDIYLSDIRKKSSVMEKDKKRVLEEDIPQGDDQVDCDFCIICALEMEFHQAKNSFSFALHAESNFERLFSDGVMYEIGKFTCLNGSVITGVFACQSRMGMVDAAILTTKMIKKFSPSYIAMTGISGGLKGRVQLGDIIVFDPTFDYGSGKLKSDGSLDPDPYQHVLDDDTKTLINSMIRDVAISSYRTQWGSSNDLPQSHNAVRIGPNACGAVVVANSDYMEEVTKHNRKLLSVEMESYGVARSAYQSTGVKTKWLCVKAISDFADEDKRDSIQEFCAFSSACFVRDFFVSNEHIKW